MRYLLFLVLFLNVLDASTTIWFVEQSMAVEANPLMKYFLDMGVLPFLLAKLLIVSVSLRILWIYRDRKIAVYGASLCAIAYLMLAVYVVYSLQS